MSKAWKTSLFVEDNKVKMMINEVIPVGGSDYDSGFCSLSNLTSEDIDTLIIRLRVEQLLMKKLEAAIS